MANDPANVYIITGLVLNAIVTILAVARSKLNLEHRITKVETLVSVLLSRSGAHLRASDVQRMEDGG